MPRGVFSRVAGRNKKQAAQDGALPATTTLATELLATEPLTPVREPFEPIPVRMPPSPSFYRNVRVAVDAIAGDELKAYARSIGITQRDVDGLSEDRLRQNCKARIYDSMED